MASVEELANECIPVRELKKHATEWVIKVLVIRRGLTKEYKTENSEGIRWQLIFVDEEGSKIQTTLFNKDVQTWNDYFDELNQSYYIMNGKINGAKPNFLSVHKDLEVAFNGNTRVVECKSQFNTQQFSNGFNSLDEVENITNGTLFDVVCILIEVKALNGEGRTKRREVMVTNESYDRKIMTLWGDFAEFDGKLLESLEIAKPVLAFCDVKCSTYQGDFVLSTTPISSVLINPSFEKASNLHKWHDNLKAQNIDISLMPSKLMRKAREVEITDILNGSLANVKDKYYKFNAKVTNINNNNDPWYHACKKCYRRVNVINSSAACVYCKAEDIDYEERYRLKIDVTDAEQYLSITLFDGARYFFGCGIKEYVRSTSEKKEESGYYRKLLLSKGKEFSILVKIDRNFTKEASNMNVIAAEIHEVEKKMRANEIEVEALIRKQRSKRTQKNKEKKMVEEIPLDGKKTKRSRKVKDASVDQHLIMDNMKHGAAEIHDVEKQNEPHESEDEIPIIKLRSRRPRKVKGTNATQHQMMVKKIKVEKI